MEDMKFCQSCGMPMNTPECTYGTNADGTLSEDYCSYCYSNGQFDDPNLTLEGMIEICVPYIVEGGHCPDAESARKMCWELMPNLKRWKKAS